jgi:hypothetical protein
VAVQRIARPVEGHILGSDRQLVASGTGTMPQARNG